MEGSRLVEDELFEPSRAFTSLWAAIWELFGLDTRRYGWRVCRICGRLFYPKDRRSVCCNTQHQSLWSKRDWARRNRLAEVNKEQGHASDRRTLGKSTNRIDGFDSVHYECTLASMPNRTENTPVWICGQCKHEWRSKDNKKPIRCAKCKSPYWDRVKTRKSGKTNGRDRRG